MFRSLTSLGTASARPQFNTSGDIMKVFKTVCGVNLSPLICRALFFLLGSLFMLAQPLHSRAQETRDRALLDVQPFSENTPRRAPRVESITNPGDVARSV